MPSDHPAHLRKYLADYEKIVGRRPVLVEELTADTVLDPIDVVYPVSEHAYAHVHPSKQGLSYKVIEPELSEDDRKELETIRTKVFERAMILDPPEDADELQQRLSDLFRSIHGGNDSRADAMEYHLLRDVARTGLLEPLLLDENLEDIQAVGTHPIHVVHRYFNMLPTSVQFQSELHLHQYLRTLSERIGRPVSDSNPIVDAALQDSSRINIVFSDDVSRRGPSFSIRRVHEHPISITQLIAWNTLDAMSAAYLWLCLENGMSLFICGEAACGKSATLNASLSFVSPRSKVYTAEDTPELRPPHQVWQRLITRETGPPSAQVHMFDLLRAALRSRPNYIVVGEIRGAEGAVAFQAMQTGHPTIATFHATDVQKMVQRLTAPPIEISPTFMDNLNVALFQKAMEIDGRVVRRVTSITEIAGYSEREDGVVTLPVFTYESNRDEMLFRGENNSFILEKKIAEQRGYEDPKEIYNELRQRAAILQTMVDRQIFHHEEVNKLLFAFARKGESALPFEVAS